MKYIIFVYYSRLWYSSVSGKHAGNYVCTGSNGFGQPSTVVVPVKVKCKYSTVVVPGKVQCKYSTIVLPVKVKCKYSIVVVSVILYMYISYTHVTNWIVKLWI